MPLGRSSISSLLSISLVALHIAVEVSGGQAIVYHLFLGVEECSSLARDLRSTFLLWDLVVLRIVDRYRPCENRVVGDLDWASLPGPAVKVAAPVPVLSFELVFDWRLVEQLDKLVLTGPSIVEGYSSSVLVEQVDQQEGRVGPRMTGMAV